MASKKITNFDLLLKSMLTKDPKPLGKSASKRQTSTVVDDANYDDTQTPVDKSASVSSKPKYASP